MDEQDIISEESFKKNRFFLGLKIFFAIIIIGLLVIYIFFPFREIYFNSSGNSNFIVNNSVNKMQFYNNMRYPNSNISYKIEDCPLKKRNEAEYAFGILENRTILNFYEVDKNEEISVTCDNSARLEDGLFIAGEGGPVKIVRSGKFNVIFKGKVLLIKESKCKNPNVAIHEIMHSLGFAHSENPNNIMYNISRCSQRMGEDSIKLINEIYSIPSKEDLVISNASAILSGRYLDANLTLKNEGLRDSKESSVNLYVNNNPIKNFEINPINVGGAIFLEIKNILISQINVENLTFEINYSLEELNKKNNKIKLNYK